MLLLPVHACCPSFSLVQYLKDDRLSVGSIYTELQLEQSEEELIRFGN